MRASNDDMTGDIVVYLLGGTYSCLDLRYYPPRALLQHALINRRRGLVGSRIDGLPEGALVFGAAVGLADGGGCE